MTEAEFAEIEQELGRLLPPPYRAMMLAYPLDPTDVNSQIALLRDRQAILAWNAELRGGEFAAEWGADRLAIGYGPSGDTYFLDLAGGSPAVFAWDHETHAVREEAPDLDRFIADQKREEVEVRASKQGSARPRGRWRFWE